MNIKERKQELEEYYESAKKRESERYQIEKIYEKENVVVYRESWEAPRFPSQKNYPYDHIYIMSAHWSKDAFSLRNGTPTWSSGGITECDPMELIETVEVIMADMKELLNS